MPAAIAYTVKCGKCGSGALYKDDDPVNKVRYIACMICGNRYPGGAKPVVVEKKKKAEVSEMAKRGTCKNCQRKNQQILSADGLCAGCYNARLRARRGGRDENEALKAAAERFQQDMEERLAGGVEKTDIPSVDANPSLDPISENHKDDPEEHRAIAFRISKEDEPLYQYLVDKARRERRTIEAEILYMVECNMNADLEQSAI